MPVPLLLLMKRAFFVATLAACLSLISPLKAEVPQSKPFGKTQSGEAVEVYSLKNQHNFEVRVMTRGATITNIFAPDKDGNVKDVVLGFDDVTGYESDANQYFGCTTGRVANRIAQGKFTLDDRVYQLAINNEPNHLHGGGPRSLDKVIWRATPFEKSDGVGVSMRYVSPHREEGYPGTLSIHVEFFVPRDSNDVRIQYRATTDQSTPVNLTNHAYFNLAGAGSETVLNHELTLHCDQYTPVDETLIPTGELKSVAGSPVDFRETHVIGERIEKYDDGPTIGYDHNLVINGQPGTLRTAARLKDPSSGRVLTVKTEQPGVQFYSGNFLKGQQGKEGKVYPHRSAICLETQHFPDSINQPTFPSVVLEPGEIYRHACHYAFTAE